MRLALIASFALAPLALLALAADEPATRPGGGGAPAADRIAAPKPPPAVPQLLVGAGDQAKPLALARADVHVVITGYLAQTTMTLTFRNDADRVLEGELTFPLPEGVSVSGYGLDVSSEIVDAVPVEKTHARVTFEKETRKGIDPGLLEHVGGNSFRTRVYPIPARGTRTVRVQYIGDLLATKRGASYSVPLRWGEELPQSTVRVEVVQAPGAPEIDDSAGLARFQFEKQGDRYVAERTFEKVRFAGDLVIALPNLARDHAIVESFTRPSADRPEHFFTIADEPAADDAKAAAVAADKPRVEQIGIAWDASLSRLKADTKRELALLEKVLHGMGTVTVDVVVFRNVPEAPVTLQVTNGDAAPVLTFLQALTCDGGTNLGALKLPKNRADLVRQVGQRPHDYAHWLLFTDGLGNLGNESPDAAPAVPVYAISADSQINGVLLTRLARESGGAFFNLRRLTDDQVLAGLTTAPFSLLSVVAKNPGDIADIYPRGATPVRGRVMVAGRLLADEAQVTLNYGRAGRVTQQRLVTLRKAGASETNLAPRFWAQQRVADLSAETDKNHDALLAVGQDFSLVTPTTSLLVLETLEQHLQYNIAPARSRKAMYAQFRAKIDQKLAAAQKNEQARIVRVAALWDQRVKWWETKFNYPADFRFVDPDNEKPQFRNGGGAANGHAALARDARTAGPGQTAAAARAPATPAPRGEARLREPAAGERLAADLPLDAAAKKDGGDDATGRAGLAIEIKPWTPDVPYLKALAATTKPADAYARYLEQRKDYLASPAYYLDCADHLLTKSNDRAAGLRVLTNLAELQLEDPQLLRILAHKLARNAERDLAIQLFEKVLKLRPEEPQSPRDLALALADRADERAAAGSAPSALADYNRALALLHQVVMNKWDRFEEIETIALMEANQVIARAKRLPTSGDVALHVPFDSRLVKNLDCDVRIVMSWDTDLTDMDLWVIEPSGEKCYYGHNRTTIGGLMSKDFTQGYGPEEYCLRRAMKGKYTIQTNYFGSAQQKLTGGTTVQAQVITNFGRPDEKRQHLTLRLTSSKETIDIGSITIE